MKKTNYSNIMNEISVLRYHLVKLTKMHKISQERNYLVSRNNLTFTIPYILLLSNSF